jgi:hypothetical protein
MLLSQERSWLTLKGKIHALLKILPLAFTRGEGKGVRIKTDKEFSLDKRQSS